MFWSLYLYTCQIGPRFGKSGSLVDWKWCHNLMVEANIHLKPLHTSILHIYKVFEPLVWLHKATWFYPHTMAPDKLAPDLGSQGHLWSENDAIMSWLRLISTSDHFIHPYYTYTQCLSYWYAVSRPFGWILILWHRPSWPQSWGVRVTCGVKMMP